MSETSTLEWKKQLKVPRTSRLKIWQTEFLYNWINGNWSGYLIRPSAKMLYSYCIDVYFHKERIRRYVDNGDSLV